MILGSKSYIDVNKYEFDLQNITRLLSHNTITNFDPNTQQKDIYISYTWEIQKKVKILMLNLKESTRLKILFNV